MFYATVLLAELGHELKRYNEPKVIFPEIGLREVQL